MEIIRTQAGNGEQGFFRSAAIALTSISRAALMSTVLVLAASSAQAADSSDRIIPPNPADVAMLRQLLALQHPDLRTASASPTQAATATPAMTTTEPNQQSSQAPAATEGEACGGVDGRGATCGGNSEVAAGRTAKLAGSFRVSLDRAMAAAGFDGAKL